MACCLQVENLTKSFGDLVLFENISFAIEDGRRVALVAKNGTGKTTLLNIIAGREDHDGGEVVPRREGVAGVVLNRFLFKVKFSSK